MLMHEQSLPPAGKKKSIGQSKSVIHRGHVYMRHLLRSYPIRSAENVLVSTCAAQFGPGNQ